MILPINDFNGNSEGEKYVWRKFKELLPADYLSFHNYSLNMKQVDVILLCPRKGILIIEIKGFLAKNIIGVPDNSIILLKNHSPEPSPLNQAIRYRNLLIEILNQNEINSVYIPCSVCYPFIDRQEYESKSLNKISYPVITITIEDFESTLSLTTKIDAIFDEAYNQIKVPTLIRNGFEPKLLQAAGNIISSQYEDTSEAYLPPDEIPIVKRYVNKTNYSKLICTKEETLDINIINNLIAEWKSGTKVYLFSRSKIIIEAIKKELTKIILQEGLSDRECFQFNTFGVFQFTIDTVSEINENLEIINGENIDKHLLTLEKLDKISNFNLGQYQIEHAGLEDIIVKAGAGTGKTVSIISRINYLIWEKKYEPIDLASAIIMITFTNDAADSMKKKLVDNFLNIYLLTKDTKALLFLESIEDMSISTIHSLSKKIIQKYAVLLGLGNDFSIISGEYQRKKILKKHLSNFISLNPKYPEAIDLSMFHLLERLYDFLKKIDDKSIDILDEDYFDFGNANGKIFSELLEILRLTQRDMNKYCIENNSVCLGDIIKRLHILNKNISFTDDSQIENVDFLFVDEFQDTDDLQIKLMQDFRKIFGFKFFVVGDIKQCIYRFRGAQARAFDVLDKSNTFKKISLNKNYRTDKTLMSKMNNIFRIWDDSASIDYSENDILVGTKRICESAEIKCFEHNAETFEIKLIESINYCKSMVEKKGEKIAILVRYNKQISTIKGICKNNGINIETEIGGDLFKIDPTIDLYKLVLALKYNKSAEYIYNLYSTSYIMEPVQKLILQTKSGDDISKYFYDNLPSTLSDWENYIQRIKTEPILKIIRDIINKAKPWETFADKISIVEGSDNKDSYRSYYINNLDQLFEKLISSSNTDYLTINKLSEYLEIMILTRQDQESRESYYIEDSNSQLICTTVHKAKGLEYDFVIIPFSNFDISCSRPKGKVDLISVNNEIGYRITRDEKNKVLFENNLYSKYQTDEITDGKKEETRILYVALTRAKKGITFLSSIDSKERRYEHTWSKLITATKK